MKLSVTPMATAAVVGLLLLALSTEAHRGPTRYRYRPKSRQSYSLSHFGSLNCVKVTTAAPVRPAPPLPANLQALIALLTQLGNLALPLFLNLLANIVPPSEPDVIIPPRLMRRQAVAATLPPCPVLPAKYTDWIKGFNAGTLRIGYANAALDRTELERLEVCQLSEIARLVTVTGVRQVLDIVEVFFLNPDTTDAREKSTIVSALSAVSRGGRAITGIVPLASEKLHKRLDNSYILLLQQYYPTLYNLLFPATATTTPPPPPPVGILDILLAIVKDVSPSLNLEQPPDLIVKQINSSLPLLKNLLPNFTDFVKVVAIADRTTTCQLLLAKFRNTGLPYGTRNTAAYIYNTLKCYTNATTSPLVATTAAKPTVAPKACGQSASLSKTLAVETSSLFVLSRIVGGVSSQSCQKIPWQVKLVIDGSGLCGGSILDATHILTAAHCIGAGIRNIQVTAGEYDTSITEGTEEVVNVPVTLGGSVIVHPQYYTTASGNEVNDLAIIKLPTPLNLNNPCIKPVCLDPNFSLAGGKNCTVSGWGVTQAGSISSIPTTLQLATVPTYDGPYCQSSFNTAVGYVTAPLTMVCAGYKQGGIDSCQGDSGGPLVCNNPATSSFVQVGIVSHGEGCALASRPGLYTSTADFYTWIKANSNIV